MERMPEEPIKTCLFCAETIKAEAESRRAVKSMHPPFSIHGG